MSSAKTPGRQQLHRTCTPSSVIVGEQRSRKRRTISRLAVGNQFMWTKVSVNTLYTHWCSIMLRQRPVQSQALSVQFALLERTPQRLSERTHPCDLPKRLSRFRDRFGSHAVPLGLTRLDQSSRRFQLIRITPDAGLGEVGRRGYGSSLASLVLAWGSRPTPLSRARSPLRSGSPAPTTCDDLNSNERWLGLRCGATQH